MAETPENSRTRLLTATIDLVRANGYAATRVEDVCAAAGVTKGSFFHHFASKEELAIAAAEQWNDRASQLFRRLPTSIKARGAIDRLLGYVGFRKELLERRHLGMDLLRGHHHPGNPRNLSLPSVMPAPPRSTKHLFILRATIDDVLRERPVKGVR